MDNNTQEQLDECLEEQQLEKEVVHWLYVVLYGVLGIAFFLGLIWAIISEAQCYVILEALLNRVPAFLLSIISLLGAALAFERISPRNYLAKIASDSMACAVVISSFMISVALVIAWVY
jgi:hypothetical protein